MKGEKIRVFEIKVMIGFCVAPSYGGQKKNEFRKYSTDGFPCSEDDRRTGRPAELVCFRHDTGARGRGHCDVMRRRDYRLRVSKTINVGAENG